MLNVFYKIILGCCRIPCERSLALSVSLRDGRQVVVNATAAIKGISCSRVQTAAVCSSRSARSRSRDRPAAAAPATTSRTARVPSASCHALRSPARIPACRSRSASDRESVSSRTSASSAGASCSAGRCLTGPPPRFMWEFYW